MVDVHVDPLLFRDQAGCEIDRVCDEQVGPLRRGERVFVRLTEDRQNPIPDRPLGPSSWVHEVPRQVRVAQKARIGAKGPESKPQRQDLPTIVFARRNDRVVASRFQTQRDGKVGVQIAQRADRRDDDALSITRRSAQSASPGVLRLSMGFTRTCRFTADHIHPDSRDGS